VSDGRRIIEIHPGEDDELIVRFPFAWDLIAEVRKVPGRRWVERERHWTVPRRPAALQYLLSRLRDEEIRFHEALGPLVPSHRPPGAMWRRLRPEVVAGHNAVRATIRRMEEELVLRGYSRRTRKTYLAHARRFLENLGK
jgi:hypothetical protein